MKHTWNLSGLAGGIGIMLLIFDSGLALEGARDGVELCIRTVIPALFPFLVLSMLLTKDTESTGRWLRPVLKWLGIPTAAESVLIPAFLGGYPVGAKCVHELYGTGLLRKAQAERLLAFCSNAGPSFLFGMVSGFFPDRKVVWFLWIIHIFSAVLSSRVIPMVGTDTIGRIPSRNQAENPAILHSAMMTMWLICCWVILFRILVLFLSRWFLWIFPTWLTVLITGMLELTNGCCDLMLIEDEKLRFVICSCMLACGGSCVFLQTASVTKGLSLRYYVLGKGLQTVFSLLLSIGVIWEYGWILLAAIFLFVLFIGKMQKSSGNPSVIPV